MRLNIEPDARTMLIKDNHSVITVKADQECADVNCVDMVNHPVITFNVPDEKEGWKYEMFSIDGVTVYFDKSLETVPEVTIAREPRMLQDKLTIRGLDNETPMTNITL